MEKTIEDIARTYEGDYGNGPPSVHEVMWWPALALGIAASVALGFWIHFVYQRDNNA